MFGMCGLVSVSAGALSGCRTFVQQVGMVGVSGLVRYYLLDRGLDTGQI